MAKFTNQQRMEIENIVANLSIKRIPDDLIIKHIQNTTGHTITRMTLWNIRQRLKKESYKWYSQLRQGQYEFLHEFKQRINEITNLQSEHHQIILENRSKPAIVQTSLIELHKLSITLSNLYDVAPYIISNIGEINGNNTVSAKSEIKEETIIV